MARVYLGLGSNLGDRHGHLDLALAALAPLGTVRRTSRRYRTAPIGFLEQPEFLNQVAELETALDARQLLDRLKRIEARLGRATAFRNAPRVIDLDILLYDDAEIDEPGLRVPHPRLRERAFVLRPLAELVDRVGDLSMTELLAHVADQHAEPIDA